MRRPFVANVTFLALGCFIPYMGMFVASQSLVPDLTIESTDFDGSVIIVGAGSAGLNAAYTLEYLGATNYTILEARVDFAGRAQETTDFIDIPLDLGAEWIHTDPRVLQDLILFDETVTDETIVYRPQTYRQALFGRFLLRLNFIRLIYQEWKFKSTTWKSYLADYIYPHVAHNLQLNTAVTSIDSSSGDGVVVTTEAGAEFTADKVIIAVPPTMLQQRMINFIPRLPHLKQWQIDRVDIRGGFKMIIEFDERFYADFTILDLGVNRILMDAVFQKPTERHVMTVLFSGDRKTNRLVQLPDDELFEFIMEELDTLFDGKASRHYVQHLIQNWSQEEYIQGTWTYNTRHSLRRIKKSIDETIYFCGAHLNQRSFGTVHGAAISGREAAQTLLEEAMG